MVHQLSVDRRQERGVVADVVLDDENGLDSEDADVVGDVGAVLDRLDDRRDQAHVSLPEEDPVERRRPGGGDLRDLAHVVGQRHDRRLQPRLAEPARELRRRHVAQVGRGDDEVIPRPLARPRQRLLRRGDVGDGGGRADVQVEELLEDDLLELAVLGQDEGVVQARHEQDVPHPEPRQVRKARQPVALRIMSLCVPHLSDQVNLTPPKDSTAVKTPLTGSTRL